MKNLSIDQELDSLHKATELMGEAMKIHHDLEEKKQTVLAAKLPYAAQKENLKVVARELERAVKDWNTRVDTYANEESFWSAEETWKVMTPMKESLTESVELIKAIVH